MYKYNHYENPLSPFTTLKTHPLNPEALNDKSLKVPSNAVCKALSTIIRRQLFHNI